MPPIYGFSNLKKGGGSPKQSIRKKNSGKIFGKNWIISPTVYGRVK
jgi:hypothetical protein